MSGISCSVDKGQEAGAVGLIVLVIPFKLSAVVERERAVPSSNTVPEVALKQVTVRVPLLPVAHQLSQEVLPSDDDPCLEVVSPTAVSLALKSHMLLVLVVQRDQIWIFSTLGIKFKSWAIFQGLFNIWKK